MATIIDVLNNARAASQNARGVTVAIIEDHEDVLTGYNKKQLIIGQTREQKKIDPIYASLFYALEKNKQNPLAGMYTPDLNLTGAFYGGFFVSITGMSFEISSSDDKTGELTNKYGPMIFGLSDVSLGSYTQNEFFEEFKKFIENTLKLKMQ